LIRPNLIGLTIGVILALQGNKQVCVDSEPDNSTPYNISSELNQAAFQDGSMAKLLSVGEAGSRGYNSYNKGRNRSRKYPIDIESLTLNEVRRRQRLNGNNRLFAVGMYQIIPDTLTEAVNRLRLDGDKFFDRDMQEAIFSGYLAASKRPKLHGFIVGDHDNIVSAGLDAAKEWRAIEDPRTGRTYNDKGAKNNRSSISHELWAKAMLNARLEYKNLITAGVHPKKAYAFALHYGGLNEHR